MKTKIILLATLVLTLAAGCGKKSSSDDSASTGGGAGATTPKAIANVWVASATFQLDMTAAVLDGSSFNAILSLVGDTSNCSCPMTMTGDQTSGTCTIGGCTWNTLGSDHGCGSAGGFAAICNHGTYTHTDTALHFDFNGFDYN